MSKQENNNNSLREEKDVIYIVSPYSKIEEDDLKKMVATLKVKDAEIPFWQKQQKNKKLRNFK